MKNIEIIETHEGYTSTELAFAGMLESLVWFLQPELVPQDEGEYGINFCSAAPITLDGLKNSALRSLFSILDLHVDQDIQDYTIDDISLFLQDEFESAKRSICREYPQVHALEHITNPLLNESVQAVMKAKMKKQSWAHLAQAKDVFSILDSASEQTKAA